MDEYDKHMLATQAILDDKFKNGKIKNLYIHEVLEGLAEITSIKERIEALRNNSDRSLNTLLMDTFREDRPRLTEKDIKALEYTPSDENQDIALAPMNLYDTARRLYIFWREDISPAKMKLLAVEILEGLHPIEAEIFKGMFIGKLPYKNVTKKLVSDAFPDLFAHEKKEEDKAKEEKKDEGA